MRRESAVSVRRMSTSALVVAVALVGVSPQDAEAQAESMSGEALGIAVGSFRMFPTLESVTSYDSNIFATKSDHRDALVEIVRPSVELRSDWNNHALNFTAASAFGFYLGRSSENYQDLSLGVDGRLDIQYDWNLTPAFSFNRRHEDRGSIDATQGRDPTTYTETIGSLALYQKFNRLFYRLSVDVHMFDYSDSGGAGGQFLSDASRDRTEWNQSLRLGYEILDGTEVWAQAGLNQRRYGRRADDLGQNRDSKGYNLTGGVTWDLGGITKLEGFVGYFQQNYEDSAFGTTGGFSFGLSGLWNPYTPLTIKPFVLRSIQETGSAAYTGYISTQFGTDVTYQLTPELQLAAGLSYAIADYERPSGSAAAQRKDDYFRTRIGLTYEPKPNFYVGPFYEFTTLNSNASGQDYSRHVVSLRLGARM